MRSVHALSLSALFLAATSLATDYGRERALRVTAETTLSLETVSFSLEVDGEPVEHGWGGGGSTAEEREVVLVHRVLERADGRPTAVRRSFETVAASSSREVGEDVVEQDRDGPLAGAVVEFREEDGEVLAEVVEGDGPADESLLAGWTLELGLDALLPSGEVEEGDTWELEEGAVRHALSLAIAPALLPPPDDDDGGGRGGFRRRAGSPLRMLQDAEWEGSATFVGVEELEGEAVLVVELELEASGELPERGGGGRRGFAPPGPAAVVESTFEVELEGRLYVSPERAAPVRLELEGGLSTERVTERERPDGATMRIESAQEGTLAHTVVVGETETE